MSDLRTKEQRGLEDLRFILHGSKRGLAALCALALLAAVCEAFLLGAVVQSISAMGTDRSTVEIDIGTASLSVSVRTLLGWAVAAAAVRACLVAVVSFVGPRIAATSRARHRQELFGAYLRADWATQSADKTGRLLQTLSNSVNDANTIILLVTQALPALITLTVLLAVSLALNPAATGVITLLGMLVGFILRPISRRAHRAARVDAAGRNATASHVSGVIAAGAEIAVLGGREGVLEIGRQSIRRAERAFARSQGLKRVVATSGQGIAFFAAALGLLILNLSTADVDFTTVGTITVLLLRCAGLAQQILNATSQYGAVVPFIEQVRTTIEHYRRRRQRFGNANFPTDFDIALADVGYTYPGTTRSAVDVQHARFERGTAVAILGPSGSGKSTLIQLVLRLREPTKGEITIGGRPAHSISETEFSRHVAYVPQAPHLVPGTVGENIRFFRPDVTDEDVVRAARLANIHKDIERLPKGYETMLDSHVDALSGGQKQRLALARALSTRPSILVLDEPTSALDATNERAVTAVLRQLRGHTTVLMITHKSSTAADFDVVLSLEGGHLRHVNRH